MKPVALLAASLLLLSLSLPRPGVGGGAAHGPASAVVYVYEKDATRVPPGVTAGLARLNRDRQIVANLLEADATDGDGQVPDQFRPAVAAARGRGLPALVVLSGSTVLSIVKAPADADAVVRAVP